MIINNDANRPLLASVVLLLAGCATQAPGSRPDDMSAAMHRHKAAQQRSEAAHHQHQYDPGAEATRASAVGGRAMADVGDWPERTYNPTSVHHGLAEVHREHGRQHLAAARTLESFEAESCRKFPKATRAACPLLGQVARVESIEGGARLHLTRGVPAKAVLEHMRCHFAFARKVGREGMSACPLYLKGIHLSIASGGGAVEITSHDEGVVRAIRQRARQHVAAANK